MPTVRSATATGLVGALVLVLGASGAWAGEPETQPPSTTSPGDVGREEGISLAVEVGVDGVYKGGQPVPITISVGVDRLIDAEIRATSSAFGTDTTHVIEAEIPGGSTKQYTVVLPIEQEQEGIFVSVVEDGTVLARVEPEARENSDEELVGVMPLVAAPETIPQTADLAVDAGTARFTLVTPELLALGPNGLALFDTIISTAADLEGIDPTPILAWVQGGGHLVVDEANAPVPALPDPWQPSPGLTTRAGLGQIRLSDGRAKAGGWETVVYPTPIDTEVAAGDLAGANFGFASSVESDLTSDAGFSLPPLGALLGLLALYIVVVGPLAFVVLRAAGRPTLLWVAVPVLAAVATTGVYLIGTDLRDSADASHATVTQVGPAPGRSVSINLVSADNPGLDLGSGWSSSSGLPLMTSVSDDIEIRSVGDSTTVEADIRAGGFAVLAATGVDDAKGLDVTATAVEADETSGTVTNSSDTELKDVAVFGSSDVDVIGPLGPGETKEFSLSESGSVVSTGELASQAWGGGFDFDLGAQSLDDDPTSQGAFEQFRLDLGPLATPIGQVWAVGWTRDRAGPVDVSGAGPATEGRTGLFTAEPVSPGDGPAEAPSFTGTAVRGPLDTQVAADPEQPDQFDQFDQFGQQLIAFTGQTVLPARPDSGMIGLELWPGAVAEIYRDGTWQEVDLDQQFTATFPIEEVATDGLLHLKYSIDLNSAFGGVLDIPTWFDPATREDR